MKTTRHVNVRLKDGTLKTLRAVGPERIRYGMRSFDFIGYDGGNPPYHVFTAYLETPGVYPVRGATMILEIL